MARRGRLKLLFQTALTFYASVDFHAYDYAAKSAANRTYGATALFRRPALRLDRCRAVYFDFHTAVGLQAGD